MLPTVRYVKHNNDILPFYFLKLLEGEYHDEEKILSEIYDYYKKGEIDLKEKGSNNKYFFEYIINPYYLWDKNDKSMVSNEIYQNLYLKNFIFDFIKVFPREVLDMRNSVNENVVTLLSAWDLKKLFKEYNEDNAYLFEKIDLNVTNDNDLHFITKLLNLDYLDGDDVYCLDILINKLNLDLTIEIKDPGIPLYTYIEQSLKKHEKLSYSRTKYLDMFKDKLNFARALYEKKKINKSIVDSIEEESSEKGNKRL